MEDTMMDKLTSIFCRLTFAVALLLLFIALWDRSLRLFDWKLSWITYAPGRLLEFSAMFMTFAIGFLLLQILKALKK
jgi:hypothetical protein